MSGERHFEWSDTRAAGLLAVGFAVVYGATAARHFLGGDAGEFAVVAGTGGFAHPPGYPLYSMYLRLAAHLPVASVAHAAALGTTVFGAAAVAVLYLAGRAWGADRFGALLAAVLFGTAPQIWWLHTVPEAFALNHLVVAGVLYAAAPGAAVTGTRRTLLLGATVAVTVAHHHMAVLLVPAGLVGFVRAVGESERGLLSEFGVGLATGASGLATYAYLPWVTRNVPDALHWGEVEGWNELVRTFFRRDYGTFELNTAGVQVGPLRQMGTLATEVTADLAYAPVLLVLAGVVAVSLRDDLPTDGAQWYDRAGLVAAWLLSGPVFVSLIGRGVDGADYLHLRKFHAQFELLCCFFAAFGASWLSRHLDKRWLAGALVAVVGVAGAASALPFLHDHTGPTVEQYVDDTLGPLPENAVLIGNSDHRYFGSAYAQRIEERRTDVDYVDSQLLSYDWSRDRVGESFELTVATRDGSAKLGKLIGQLQRRGRKVFVTHLFDAAFREYWRPVPVGTAWRLDREASEGVSVLANYRRNRELFENYAIEPRPHVPETSWNHLTLTHYALVWRDLADRLAEAGERRPAAEARKIAETLAPGSSE